MESPALYLGALVFGFAFGLTVNQSLVPKPLVSSAQSAAPQAKKKRRRKKAAALTPPTLTQTGPDPVDIQNEELEALRAIYLDDFSILPNKDKKAPASFKIFLKASPSNPSKNYCSVYLVVNYTSKYPEEPPVLKLINSVNLPNTAVHQMLTSAQKLTADKSLQSAPMIQDICTLIESELALYNIPPEIPKQFLTETPAAKEEEKTDIEELRAHVKKEIQRRKRTEGEIQNVMLNSAVNVKNLGKELSKEFEPKLTSPISSFDYHSYFEEEMRIGRGGAGHVYRARNKIDGCIYAIKKIRLKGKKQSYINYILKEVFLLSRLQHQNIVRYHNAWFEEESSDEESSSDEEVSIFSDSEEEEIESSEDDEFSGDWLIAFQTSSGHVQPAIRWDENGIQDADSELVRKLYIQMEFCGGDTLGGILGERLPPIEERWRLFREVLQGLIYIHSRGMIHRDLKPSNIFLTYDGTAKLGDFGLATFTEKSKTETKAQEVLEEHSGAIGTPLYCSPEQLSGGKYDQKSDMFSLGIIFFEMWRSFSSQMQKYEEIRVLRNDNKLPPDFIKSVPQQVTNIILWLTKPQPQDRPNAEELLNHDDFPHKIDTETFNEFLRVVSNPDNVESSRLLDYLFSRKNPSYIDITYTLSEGMTQNAPQISRRKKKLEAIIRSSIAEKVRHSLEVGGYIRFDANLFSPYSSTTTILCQKRDGQIRKCQIERQEGVSKFMEPSGIVLELPSNLVAPWARMICSKNLGGIIKRYSIGNVYWSISAGEHPKEVSEAAFDICYDNILFAKQKSILESEIIKIAYCILQQFSHELPMLAISISDTRILDAIFDYCQVPQNLRPKALNICQHINRRKWVKIRNDLQELGIHFSIAEKLGQYFKIKGSYDSVLETLKKQPIKKDEVLMNLLENDLKELVKSCGLFGVHLTVDLGLIPENLLYYSGIIFKITSEQLQLGGKSTHKERVTFAMGGRFDNLLTQYSLPQNINSEVRRKHTFSGFGCRIFIEKVLSAVLQADVISSQRDEWVKGPSVFVTSQSHNAEEHEILLKERIELTCKLWHANISAMYMYEDLNIDEIVECCRRYRIRFLVILRTIFLPKEENVARYTVSARIRDFAHKNSESIEDKSNVVSYIQEKIDKLEEPVSLNFLIPKLSKHK